MSYHPLFTQEELTDLIDSVKWYHQFEIYPGIITPGRMHIDAEYLLTQYGVHQDLTGLDVLEIGAFDGAYTFELERRGAKVTAIDIQHKDRTGFAVAHKINQSKVKYVQCDVMNLNSVDHGKYDMVMFLGVYYHILHPLLVFQNIYNVLRNDGTVFYSGHILEYSYKIDSFLAGYKDELSSIVHNVPLCHFAREKHAGVWSNWFIPNLLCLNDWLTTAGFKVFKEDVYTEHSTMSGAARKINNFKLVPWESTNAIPSLTSSIAHLNDYKKVLFFGAGGGFCNCKKDIVNVFDDSVVLGIVDNDSSKHGMIFEGYRVFSPDDITTINPDLIIVSSTYAENIFYQLKKLKRSHKLKFDIKYLLEPEKFLDTSTGHEVY